MHDGRFKTLSAVLKHYTSGVQKSKTLSPKLEQPIVLSANEQVDLTAFLLTLSDKSFLFNPNFVYPKHILLP
jgi:cytochrome c peroxidase